VDPPDARRGCKSSRELAFRDARRGTPQGNLEDTNWEAILVRTQNDTAPGILGTLAKFRDHRVRHVIPRRLPEASVGGYEVTDWAVSLARGEWLVVTNADNLYSPEFLHELTHTHADVVAYDWCVTSRSTPPPTHV